jgi:hypothetical protein
LSITNQSRSFWVSSLTRSMTAYRQASIGEVQTFHLFGVFFVVSFLFCFSFLPQTPRALPNSTNQEKVQLRLNVDPENQWGCRLLHRYWTTWVEGESCTLWATDGPYWWTWERGQASYNINLRGSLLPMGSELQFTKSSFSTMKAAITRNSSAWTERAPRFIIKSYACPTYWACVIQKKHHWKNCCVEKTCWVDWEAL